MSICILGRRLNAAGYSVVWFEGKHVREHRLNYAKANGLRLSDLSGKVVRHKCDNPGCVNPEHLEIGTQAENVRDMVERSRKVTVRGSKHKFAKLKEEDIPAIRQLSGSGLTQAEIARMFDVDKALIWRILNKKSWAHVR